MFSPVPLRNRLLWLLFALLLALGLLFVFLPSSPQTWRLASSRQSEPFTELYFERYDITKKYVEVGETYQIAYSVVNHEAADKRYQVETSITSAQDTGVKRTDQLAVARGAKQTRLVSFTPKKLKQTYQLRVALTPSGGQQEPQIIIWRFKS